MPWDGRPRSSASTNGSAWRRAADVGAPCRSRSITAISRSRSGATSIQLNPQIVYDVEGDQTYTEKLGHYADINKTFSEVRVEEYDAVYAAGGRGPEYIRTDKRIQAMVRHFHETGKPIFTICHGVQILMAVPEVLKGKKVAGLGACEPEVTAVGGIYIDVKPTEAYVDGNMVSAKGWTGLGAFMRECMKVLGTRITHEYARTPAARRGALQGPRSMSLGVRCPGACMAPCGLARGRANGQARNVSPAWRDQMGGALPCV